ncbi:MAG: NifB/NifX family molybdenum-iron cluster-binding protein [Lachnospiraceae bacterium]
MPRPSKEKRICRLPQYVDFAPAGQERKQHRLQLTVDEYETIRLIDYLGYTQEECAAQMEIGRATVQAVYAEARKKLGRFLVEGAALEICGGSYRLCSAVSCTEQGGCKKEMRGEKKMKIAVTYENGEVFQHFGHTEQFKVYEVENGKIVASEVLSAGGSGHGALAGLLSMAGVDVLICGGIGGGARNALAEAGIELYPGACGNADAQVEAFLAGSLNYDPNTMCNHHGRRHDHGHSCGEQEHHCGGHCGS